MSSTRRPAQQIEYKSMDQPILTYVGNMRAWLADRGVLLYLKTSLMIKQVSKLWRCNNEVIRPSTPTPQFSLSSFFYVASSSTTNFAELVVKIFIPGVWVSHPGSWCHSWPCWSATRACWCWSACSGPTCQSSSPEPQLHGSSPSTPWSSSSPRHQPSW